MKEDMVRHEVNNTVHGAEVTLTLLHGLKVDKTRKISVVLMVRGSVNNEVDKVGVFFRHPVHKIRPSTIKYGGPKATKHWIIVDETPKETGNIVKFRVTSGDVVSVVSSSAEPL